MNEKERKIAAKRFAEFWTGKGYEKGQSQQFWTSLLRDVLGVEHPEEIITFEDKVVLDHTSFIDGHIKSTHVLIEQKSLGKKLNAPIKQSDGSLLTPFQQAKKYSIELPYSERPRWIITCNFEEFYIYDMEKPHGEPEKIKLKDLEKEAYRLTFIVEPESELQKKEEAVSKEAGDIVGKIYDEMEKHYKKINEKNPDGTPTQAAIRDQQSLNMLCVRLVFCLYAEDSGLFKYHNQFRDYVKGFDAKHLNTALKELFKVLNVNDENGDRYQYSFSEELEEFPYVNGGLFENENIIIPPMTEEIKDILVNKASSDFDWSEISPTIFGAIFESTLNPETRHARGMHYTSIENIHKVIDPLFLNDLNVEFEAIKKEKSANTLKRKLEIFQQKLSSLSFMDPAAGSGNFLTETYLSLRKLENEVLSLILSTGEAMQTTFDYHKIKVNINQFYGIEINDFAVSVAKTALWIAEYKMFKETLRILPIQENFLPLTSIINIKEGNRLRLDWNEVVSKHKLNYIMGNPPFAGSSNKDKAAEQKEDKEIIFKGAKGSGKLDYVACWYKKAFDYIKGTDIEVAFVSTNSITQGEQVRPLWEPLLSSGLHINFAYRTFNWVSEAKDGAAVHCIIICVSCKEKANKFIVEGDRQKFVEHINGYLIDAPDFYIESRGKPPKGMPKLTQGNKPWDDGGLIVSPKERELLIRKYPQLSQYVKIYWGSREFINKTERYCLWFDGVSPEVYVNIPEIRERFKIVRDIRLASPTTEVQKQAQTPMLFSQIRQPKNDYIFVPETSSQSRKYIPMGFMSKDVVISNSAMFAENASLYMFGIMQSNVHMAWVKTLCGRMKSDYRYSPALYNNFPWPEPTPAQKIKIEKTAQAILDARAKYPNSSLADLYGENMYLYSDLLTAHQNNDRAVWEAYGKAWTISSESECVAHLMKMYQTKIK